MSYRTFGGRLRLEPGDACQLPPGDVTTDVIWGLSESAMHSVLGDIAIYYPEAFMEALLEHQRIKDVIKAKRAARQAVTA